MKVYKTCFLFIMGIITALCLSSCIDDEEGPRTCVPAVATEADLIDSWIIEYNKYIQKDQNQIISQKDFVKQEGKFMEITEDHTWTYKELDREKEIKKNGTWNYENGVLHLKCTTPEGVEKDYSMQVYRLCSLRLRTDFKFEKTINGEVNDFLVTTVFLRNKMK